MASPPTDATDLCNGALLRFGDQVITTLTDSTTNNRERLCFHHYPRARDRTLEAFPWQEALVRAAILAYTEPAATLTPGATTGSAITFTASVASFAATDVGKSLRGDGVAGQATIVGFTSTTQVTADITQTFSSTAAIASGSWRLYNATPAWGEYAYSFVKPTGLLRVHRVKDRARYAVEGQVILSDTDSLNLLYITQLTDTTKYSPALANAIEVLLAATLAEPITGSASKAKQFYDLWTVLLRQARGVSRLEGSPDALGPYPLVDVRSEGI